MGEGSAESSEMVRGGLGSLEPVRALNGGLGAVEPLMGVLGGIGSAEICLCTVSICRNLSRLKTGAGLGGSSPSSSESEVSLISSSYVSQYVVLEFSDLYLQILQLLRATSRVLPHRHQVLDDDIHLVVQDLNFAVG
jgi:hypothetical protein